MSNLSKFLGATVASISKIFGKSKTSVKIFGLRSVGDIAEIMSSSLSPLGSFGNTSYDAGTKEYSVVEGEGVSGFFGEAFHIGSGVRYFMKTSTLSSGDTSNVVVNSLGNITYNGTEYTAYSLAMTFPDVPEAAGIFSRYSAVAGPKFAFFSSDPTPYL